MLRKFALASVVAAIASAGVIHAEAKLHVVAIGQGYAYPINEGLRTTVLRGFEFGYRPSVTEP